MAAQLETHPKYSFGLSTSPRLAPAYTPTPALVGPGLYLPAGGFRDTLIQQLEFAAAAATPTPTPTPDVVLEGGGEAGGGPVPTQPPDSVGFDGGGYVYGHGGGSIMPTPFPGSEGASGDPDGCDAAPGSGSAAAGIQVVGSASGSGARGVYGTHAEDLALAQLGASAAAVAAGGAGGQQ